MDIDAVKNEFQKLLEFMGFAEDIESIDTFQGMTARVVIKVRRDSNLLIGERGSNLIALEHVLKKIIKKKYGDDFRFTLDINSYRMSKLEDLKQDVKVAAKEVRLYRKEVSLRPMSAFERRIVHLLLTEYPDITTESVGQEPERRVVIKPYP